MKKHIYVILCVLGSFTSVFAQQSAIYTSDLAQYNQALELYHNKQFLAAQTLFDQVKDDVDDENIKAECTYYAANCAVWLNQKGADQLMEDFVTEYPTSVKKNAAYLDVANYYFDQGKYAYARKWYEKADPRNMSRAELEKYHFNKGYAYFKIQRFNEAKKYLNRVQESKTYGAKAKYYLGFIAYEGDNYQKATKLFDEVRDLKAYNKNLSYFKSDMSFKAGKFQEAIDEGLPRLASSRPSEKSELNKIIGESYFNLEQYSTAIPYLKGYKGRKGKWNNTDYYQLGYAYYKQGDYTKAISEFNKIVGGKNATAQNAYYHLAESYLKSDQKQQALNAFKNASEMNFEPKIKEDALYNYAKLSYEIGNSFESAPSILQTYLDTYPDSDYEEEINDLLISSFITARDYKGAMQLLEKSRNFDNKEVLEQVAFYRAVELFNEGNYDQATYYFDKAIVQQINPKFTSRAIYWKAEGDYLQNRFDDALIGYKQFKNNDGADQVAEYGDVDYNIGYTYFKLKRYDKAAEHFEKYTKADITEDKITDTYLRLGDSYFIQSKYWPAMESYNKAISNGGKDADYAHYQKAISYGFVKKNDKKISDLELFIKQYPRSTYRDDAIFALGDTYVSVNKTDRGIQAYDRLIREMPKSSFVPKALLKQGLVFYNGNQGDRALSKFKKIAEDYPGSEEALQAVNTARLIYVDLGRTDEYASWVQGLSFVSVSDTDLDNTSYEAVEKQVLEGSDSSVISALKKYLDQFPNGLHALKSHFQLAQLYLKKSRKEEAIPHYEYVLQQERTEYTEESLAKLGQLFLEDQSYDKAIPVLERLEAVADFPENIIFAQSNLMKVFYQLVKYEKAIAYADKVLANPKIQKDVQTDAKIFTARAAMQMLDEERAEKAYAEVEKIATGELAAEALYHKAYFKNKAQDFNGANQVIQQLAKKYAGYKYYGAKGLVLMAKNFYGLEDAYQASYILESVIKNFGQYPDVIQEAREELRKIKEEEAKTNSSIQTEQ